MKIKIFYSQNWVHKVSEASMFTGPAFIFFFNNEEEDSW